MSLRSFFLWFWGIVFGSGIAGGATLAVLQSPPKPAPAPAIQQVALTEPLPVPPVPTIGETAGPQVALPRPRPRVIATRQSHEVRRFAELAPLAPITVVPPIPPAPNVVSENTGRVSENTPRVSENMTRILRLPSIHRSVRIEPRGTTTPPPAEPRPRAYARNYPRYSYYSYSYPYRYSYYYPYPYYYSYSY